MLRNFKTLIDDMLGGRPPEKPAADELRVACAALLVHCARADGDFSEAEERKLRDVLAERYELTPDETQTLIDAAIDREAETVDLHRLTWVLHQNLARPERLEFVRLLWEISHADKVIDHDEKSIVSLVAGMLDVEMANVVAIRQQVERR